MLWKIRTELADRPGALAELAARCGADDINILSLEVFTSEGGAIDELVVSTGVGWTAEQLTALVAEAGCVRTTVRPCQADVLSDAPTRYLRAVLRILDDPCTVDEELERLQGLDEYTAAEWARADVLVEIAGLLAEKFDTVVEGPRPGSGVPAVRMAGIADAEAVIAMHDRCSFESRTRRYHVPMPRLTLRTARHLSAPAGGVSLVAEVNGAVIGMATAAPWEELGSEGISVMEVAVLVEDGWQRQGLGSQLLAGLIREARSLGADRVVCMVQPENQAMIRTIERLRMRTMVVNSGGNLAVTVALSDQSLSHSVTAHSVDGPSVAYRQERAVTTPVRPPSTRAAGHHADQHALTRAGAVPAIPDRGQSDGADGADRGGRS